MSNFCLTASGILFGCGGYGNYEYVGGGVCENIGVVVHDCSHSESPKQKYQHDRDALHVCDGGGGDGLRDS